MLIFGLELKLALIIIIMGALPVIELRGAIPYALAMGVEPNLSYFLAVLGNLLPILPLLLILNPLRELIEKKIIIVEKFFAWLDRRTLRRKGKVEQYGIIGLIMLTALPLPTTGAWTASLVAVMLKLPLWPSAIAISSGVLLAGLIVSLIARGVF